MMKIFIFHKRCETIRKGFFFLKKQQENINNQNIYIYFFLNTQKKNREKIFKKKIKNKMAKLTGLAVKYDNLPFFAD